MRTCLVAVAMALTGCAAELDLDEGPILEDLFGGDPFEVSDDALAALPQRFVMLASEDASADAATICSWLIARLQRSCNVVRSEGDRLDFQRAAATPGMLIIGSPDAVADFPRFRSLRWRDTNGYLFITRRFNGVLSDAGLRRQSLAAGDGARSVAESLIAAAGLSESDFEQLIGLGDLRARPRGRLIHRSLCEGVYDVIVVPSQWRPETEVADDALPCTLDFMQIADATAARLIEARRDLDRRAVGEDLLAAFAISRDDHEMILNARDVLYAEVIAPMAEDALRRALTIPLDNRWRDEGVQRYQDLRAGLAVD